MGQGKDLDCLRSHDRDELATRSRMLQLETNRRRRAHLVKRKMDTMKEERRRQDILTKRREQIREATERYQRLKKNYMPESGDPGREYAIPALDDALHAICSNSTGQHHQVAPTNPRNQYSPRSADPSLRSAAGYYQNKGPCSAGRKRRPPENGSHNDTFVIQQTSPGPTVSSLHARQLHNHSLRNLAASRSLFEQQLVQQQAMLVKQQQESLKMFDSAIQNEMERDYYHGDVITNGVIDGGGDCVMGADRDATQCDSPTSVDSLDVPTTSAANGGKSEFSTDSLQNNLFARQVDAGKDARIPNTDALNGGFAEHSRSFSSPRSNVAVVMPCFVQHRDESVNDTAVKNNNDKSFFHPSAEDSNNNNLDKEAVYGSNGATVRRADPFSIANNGRRNEQYYQDLIVNRVSAVDVIGNRNVPVNVDQTSDWKTNNGGNYINQMDNVWARPLNSAEMTRTRYHTSSVPLSTIATIEGGNVVYNHNQAPLPKQASCILPDNATVSSPIATSSAVPIPAATTCGQMAPDVSEAAPMMIPGTDAVTPPSAVSYHCSQTVPGSFVTVSNVYSTQVQNDGMQQYGKTTNGPPPMMHWQAVSAADVPSARQGINAGEVTMTLTQPTPVKSTLRFAPKGILKQRDEDPTVIPAPRNRFTPGGTSMKHNGRNVHIRDSVEVIKEHQKAKTPKNKKKSVRFADMEYEESENSTEPSEPSEPSEDSEESDEGKRFFVDSTKNKVDSGTERTKKSSRPISAQASGSSDSIDPTVREPRSFSAGTQRTHLQPHPPSQPPSGRAMMSGSGAKNVKTAAVSSVVGETPNRTTGSNTNNSAVEMLASKQPSQTSPEVIRGINGLSLSRTPTDDEINKLWQKVRSCLSSTRTHVAACKSGTLEAASPGTAPPTTVSHKYMDGQSIVAQLRVGGAHPGGSTTGYMNFQREPRSRVRHKFSMAGLNHYNAKKGGGLLQQRRPGGSVVVSYVPKMVSSAPPGRSTLHGYKQAPHARYTSTIATETCPNQALSDSMASFLRAEELSGQPTITESQIEDTLERSRQRQPAHGMLRRTGQKASSALSLEEQRLLQSLERLNQRLEATETKHIKSTQGGANYAPRPPAFHEDSPQDELLLNRHAQDRAFAQADAPAQTEPHTGMFRGRAPLTGGYRRQKVSVLRQHPFHGGSTR